MESFGWPTYAHHSPDRCHQEKSVSTSAAKSSCHRKSFTCQSSGLTGLPSASCNCPIKMYWIPSEYPGPDTHHAFPVVHSRQILLELFAHVEVHVVVLEGAEGLDDYVVPLVDNVLVRLQQGCNFPDGDIHICDGPQSKEEAMRNCSGFLKCERRSWFDVIFCNPACLLYGEEEHFW